MACDLQPHGDELLRCSACGRTVDPRVFDVTGLGECLTWHKVQSSRPLVPRATPREPLTMQGPPPKNLAIVACYYNFAGYRSLQDNYLRFLNEMRYWGVPLFVAELAIGDEPFLGDPFLPIRTTDERHIVWQKEALLNRLVAELPRRYDAVAWIDADMIFLDRHWYPRTLAALADYPVLQLWDRWHFSDPMGQICLTGQSVGHLGHRFMLGKGHPGGAWAARREVFPLYSSHVLGGGDTAAIDAWLGLDETFLQQNMPPAWRTEFQRWAADAWDKVQGQVTTLPGDCLHLYHGSRENRRYSERARWLLQQHFDPDQHVTIDRDGLLAWTDAAPTSLRSGVWDYFTNRNEDEGLL